MVDLAALRREYRYGSLSQGEVDSDPITQFRRWFAEAMSAEVLEPTAMTLATADSQARPSARIVLLKGVDELGFVFHTNYQSRKADELEANPAASLLFFWKEIDRQVRVEGEVHKLSQEESRLYFASRPRGSQLGAWASPQSRVLASREQLRELLRQTEQRFADDEVPLPPSWGGYRLRPHTLEFWQGRESRLHDRLRYREDEGGWKVERLAP